MSSNLTSDQINKAIQDAASTYGVSAGLLTKMLEEESGLNPNTPNSSAGAIGIAQFMPDTARSYGIDPTDPIQSIGAAAHLLADNAKQFNGGKLPSLSDKNAWLLAAAAYNAGPQAVAEAQKKAFLNKDFDGNGNWVNYLPKETQKYVGTLDTNGGSSLSPSEWANSYSQNNKIKPSTSTPISGVATPSTPGTLQPPNIADFQTDDGNGGKVTDTAGYYKAWNDYVQTQQAQQKLQSGPLAQYVNDTINDITQQIEAGKLDVSKANNLLTTKVNAFKDANDVYSSKAFTAGAPVGATTIPGAFSWSPGTAIPGGGTVLNPLQQALDISNQAQGLYSGMQTPQVPILSSIMAGYGGQYGGTPGASAAPNPLQQAVQASGPQGPVGPNGPVGGQPMGPQGPQGMPPPPPAPPPAPSVGSNNPPAGSTSVAKDATASSSNASASDVAALARILAQQAQGLGASN